MVIYDVFFYDFVLCFSLILHACALLLIERFVVLLGWLVGVLGSLLRPSWGSLGGLLEPLGGFLEPLGRLFERNTLLKAIFDQILTILGGPCWDVLTSKIMFFRVPRGDPR